MSARTHGRVRADASVLPPCNFITDATVSLSHGRPSGHRPTICPSIRPSVIVRVTTLHMGSELDVLGIHRKLMNM
jgi:hypothetical protein